MLKHCRRYLSSLPSTPNQRIVAVVWLTLLLAYSINETWAEEATIMQGVTTTGDAFWQGSNHGSNPLCDDSMYTAAHSDNAGTTGTIEMGCKLTSSKKIVHVLVVNRFYWSYRFGDTSILIGDDPTAYSAALTDSLGKHIHDTGLFNLPSPVTG